MTKKILKLLLGLIVFCIIVYSVKLLISFPFTPDKLVVMHELESSDLIVIASGEMERVEYGFKLAKQGIADTIFYSSGYIDKYQREYISRNVVEGVNFISTTNSISTYTDAKLTKQFIKGKDIKKIVLVTSPYHSYRVYKTFSKVIPNVQFISCPVEGSFFNVQDVKDKNSFSNMIFRSEQFKYLFYSIKYGI